MFELIKLARGVVGRAIIYSNNIKFLFRVIESEKRLQSFADGAFLIETGHNNGHGREVPNIFAKMPFLQNKLFAYLKIGDQEEHLKEEGDEKRKI